MVSAKDEATTRDQDWHAWRQQGIGGSDAAAVCGIDRFRSPVYVWLEKRGLLEPTEETEAMLWGRLLENAVIGEYERRTGHRITRRQELREHPEHGWMRCTQDGVVQQDDEIIALYEGKTTSWQAYRRDEWADGDVPLRVQLQCQHNMAVTGLLQAVTAVLIGGQRLEWREVLRDDAAIAQLIEIEREFWEGHVLTGIPPPADASEQTNQALKRAYAQSTQASVALPPTAEELALRYVQARSAEKAAKSEAEAAQNELMLLMQGAELGLLDDRELIHWTAYERKTVDLDALRNQHPELVEQFTSKMTQRRFSVAIPKEETDVQAI